MGVASLNDWTEKQLTWQAGNLPVWFFRSLRIFTNKNSLHEQNSSHAIESFRSEKKWKNGIYRNFTKLISEEGCLEFEAARVKLVLPKNFLRIADIQAVPIEDHRLDLASTPIVNMILSPNWDVQKQLLLYHDPDEDFCICYKSCSSTWPWCCVHIHWSQMQLV